MSKCTQEPHDNDNTQPLGSGVTFWQHRVTLHEGCLALYWTQGGASYVRTFTRDETADLLDVLYQARDDIFRIEGGHS